jgi:hypothetical protein
MDAARVCSYAVADDAWLAALHACEAVDVADEYCPRCELLRDVFGNPFRPVSVDPAWLARNAGAVLNVARSVYEGRRFEDLPVLADALEEAGCADPAILAHCRSAGPHVRGCWVVGALLGEG